MEWYRDPIWQFVGTIIGLVAIFASYNIFKLQRRQKKISFEIISNSSLIKVEDEVTSKMQVFFDKKPVKDVNLLIVRIINSGNEPIVKKDYETPIELGFSDNTEILEVDVVQVSPISMKVEIINTKNRIAIQPLLLNPGDFITTKTLLTNNMGSVEVSGRIAGVKEISRLGLGFSIPLRFDLFFIFGASICGSFIIAASAYFLYVKELPIAITTLIIGIMILIIVLFYISLTLKTARVK